MTTIAYHHKSRTVAYDSRRTIEGMIATDSADKMIVSKGVCFWMAGCVCDYELFISMYFGESSELTPECYGLVWNGRELYYCGVTDSSFWREPISENFAIGSGETFALSAMDFGCDAVDAVQHARTRDIYTGGKVNSYKLETK